MYTTTWTPDKIRQWVDSQDWYQSIAVTNDIVTPGKTNSQKRMDLLDLSNIANKSVLDIGCNAGMYCFEAKQKNAARVTGIELRDERLEQARTLAKIKQMDIEFLKLDLFKARELGSFDIVFCFAVITEVTDIINALLTLKDITRETLYLEMAVFGSLRNDFRFPFRYLGVHNLQWIVPYSVARLRKIKNGWAIVPDMRFLETLLGDKFEIFDLGNSVRYRMLKLVNKELL